MFDQAAYLFKSNPLMSIYQHAEALKEIKAREGRQSSKTHAAFMRLADAYARDGRRIDELRFHIEDEAERFFSLIAQGADGCAYWLGAANLAFYLNNGKSIKAHIWWWNHLGRPKFGVESYLTKTCEGKKCVSIRHRQLVSRGVTRQFTEAQMLGLLQNKVKEIGYVPLAKEWTNELHMHPQHFVYARRFGSWASAVRQAGLIPHVVSRNNEKTAEDCIETLRFAKNLLGRWPKYEELRNHEALRTALKRAYLPTAPVTIRRRLGPWDIALQRASDGC